MATMTRAERVRRADPHRHFLTHCAVMPGWHKVVILLAAFLAVAGFAGLLLARSGADAHIQLFGTPAAAAHGASDAAGASGASAKHEQAADPGQRVGSLSRASMPAMVIGASILAGFIGGWYLRAYLVPVMGLAILAAAGVWALAHFGVIHAAPAAAAGASGKAAPSGDVGGGTPLWFAQYALHAKNAVLAHLPSAGSGAFAALLGFRRW